MISGVILLCLLVVKFELNFCDAIQRTRDSVTSALSKFNDTACLFPSADSR